MRSTLVKACTATFAGLLLLSSSPAFAQNVHFVGQPSARCQGSDLLVSFKVAGLGDGEIVEVTADATATARCINRGGNIPPGQTADVTATGEFGPASRNGRLTGTLRLSPDEECPGRQRLQVTYEDVVLMLENGDTAFLDGTFVCPR